jgi:hypothetical protein
LVSKKNERKMRTLEIRREQERRKEEKVKRLMSEKKVKPDLVSWYVGRMGLTVFNEYPFNFQAISRGVNTSEILPSVI